MSEEASLSSLAVEKLTLTIVPQMLHGKDIKESSSKMSAKSTGTPNVWGMTNHDSCNVGPQSRMFLRCARQINSCCVGFTARNSCCFLHASQIAPLSIEPCTGRNTFCRIPLINVRPTRCLLIIPHALWKMISRKYNLGKKQPLVHFHVTITVLRNYTFQRAIPTLLSNPLTHYPLARISSRIVQITPRSPLTRTFS